jgi:DNA mismatch endonuclease (patch repair protein)
MADNLSRMDRSLNMSRIRSRGNKTTELRLIELMRGAGITGWRRKSKLPGKPDFVFPLLGLAVFVDGCYWHGCKRCALASKSNVEYWVQKISGNESRDKLNAKLLRADGWTVLRIWEHDLKTNPMRCLKRLLNAGGRLQASKQ